ncbi:ABC transporter substrate-binding protein [Kineothrix sp. MB12-C1]|uniref:ABC transporter substrate-binding protein n=1 Tax=Kineothrix sp. MB12-C1 TaxID=3070215 RepID=UPI0027D223AE|nr:ABC transporter substrate-binding protein [Kineothrix sp. MB12-C1]WMC91980.1 ABC transporter substrate-binding protein [Kineothrix sp. MB12-C1]
MRRMKISLLLTSALTAAMILIGCSNNSETAAVGNGEGKVYYLNFKPEVSEVWEEIAQAYEEETGISVKVQTAASGTYEQTLKSEMAKSGAPTLFQINGPIGYQNWKEYTMDLSEIDLYNTLLDKSLAITGVDEEGVYGLPYVVEGYGIIYNDEIMQRYFALSGKGTNISSMEEINSFAVLKEVVEDMTANKEALEIDGVFASTSLSPGEDWRWQTHLMNVSVYYEYQRDNVQDKAELDFGYNQNMKNIFDLYINNSCTEPSMLGAKSVDDSMSEFALGRVAMVQNGNWAWNQIKGVEGNIVSEENIKFLPIYTGVEGEEKQGLCVGTEGFLCINSKASEADRAATINFLTWVFQSEKGKDYVTNQLGFIAPFNTFEENETPSDPLAQEVIRSMSDENLYGVPWVYTTFPSQTFKDDLGADISEYTSGQKDWDTLVEETISEWKTEKAALSE